MKDMRWVTLLVFVTLYSDACEASVKELTNHADYKSLLKTRNNVLIFFNKVDKEGQLFEPNMNILREAANMIKGEGTIAFVDCVSKEGQKLCKLVKGTPDDELFLIKHYKNGEFNKVYDRVFAPETIRRFMLNPDGPLPYADEPGAEIIIHPEKQEEFLELLKISKHPVLVLFYAPWCGHCKNIKPHFNAAAKELMNEVVFVAIDLTKSGNKPLGKKYKIPGYPTLIRFFKNEEIVFQGDRSKESIVSFAKDLTSIPVKKPTIQEPFFSNSEVTVLNEDNFEDFVSKNPSVAVMFFASWCGHCKKVKPEYEKAAQQMKKDGIKGVLAATDATINSNIANKYEVRSFPTFLYFKNGKKEFKFDERTSEKLVKFMKNPVPPSPSSPSSSPSPPSAEKSWSLEGTNVIPLNSKVFDQITKMLKFTFIIFYSPTCPHCKSSKSYFLEAAKKFSSNQNVMFAAVDCTVEGELCKKREIYGYPTFEFLKNGERKERYEKERTAENFVKFVETAMKGQEDKQPKIEGFEFVMNVAIATPETFNNLVKVGKRLILFFKPEDESIDKLLKAFNEAAEITTPGSFVVIDCTQYKKFCKKKDIGKFPTFQVYNNGRFDKFFKGDTKEMFISALSDRAYVPPLDFGEYVRVGTYVNFDNLISSKKSLVFFYAPWCGHCKHIKPVFIEAASRHKSGLFIAVDCTTYQALCKKYDVRSFPTLKVFDKGEVFAPYSGERSASGFIDAFNKTKEELSPKADDQFTFVREVKLATDKNFPELVDGAKSLVMFYAPWCEQSKKARSEFSGASILKRSGKFIAVDCTKYKDICDKYEVSSFPKFLIFKNGHVFKSYNGPRKIKAFEAVFDEKEKSEHTEL